MLAEKIKPLSKDPGHFSNRTHYSAAAASVFVFFVFCCLVFFLPPYSRSNGYFGCIREKHRRLETLPSPKVVLIGGSNLPYSMDSTLIEKRLHLPVVDMGLSANLGLRFMLEEVKGQLHPGDIVIVSPEHQLFFGLLDGCKDLFRVVQAYP
ncbi:MAG: hypothetical protein C5B53_12100, partial [Candidatus Melainabacteria bacterium]